MAELCPLAEELSCSICLEPFKLPVTTPCGHNFCGSCLDGTWEAQGAPYSCPQCRAVYRSRPQLQKNTVLCAIVEQFLQVEPAQEVLPDGWMPPTRRTDAASVACDLCMNEKAIKTCLVCMASFCPEHLRPHLDSPAFRDHPLQPPIGNLMNRKCPQHNRLRELFCPQHSQSICHICLVEHKACSPVALSQASADLEAKLRSKLAIIHGQINSAGVALEDVRARQQIIQENARKRLEQIRQEYMEMKALLDASEASSTRKIKEEEKRVSSKLDSIYQILLKKQKEIKTAKEEIEHALTKEDEFEFLEKSGKLQALSTKPVYVPKVELNQELVKEVCQSSSELKNQLKLCIKQQQDKKKPEEPASSMVPRAPKAPPHPTKKIPKEEKKQPKKPSPSPSKGPTFGAPEQLDDLKQAGPDAAVPVLPSSHVFKAKMLETFLGKTRAELLEYAAEVILDYNTAHINVALSENYTVASAVDTLQKYHPHPQRFLYECPQVLGLHCYKKGIHYWEVELHKSSFCGVGVCYGSMPRQGTLGRLGRNGSSWCVEWFNTEISTWHNNVKKTLSPTKASRVGVLLNCDHGFIIFFAVTEKVHVLYKYRVDFEEALYPAFWVFSAGTSLSICSNSN
ncbi:E3 ubiquitin/ISG15 ligase TRIM25-like [Sorex fumeus]|uniref:E3 ubiquitin/ISG15 ligase TRIM25-like n=1 Tax=Sorex fumeus TaxID=62283 RepID=UPI0024AE06DA|nr:E3 ubiquitin/ISG15 ligase TRIM25-like [Sorex fumeus]